MQAAAALGLAPEHVFKTLIAKPDGRQLVVALVPAAELNLKALAIEGSPVLQPRPDRPRRPAAGRPLGSLINAVLVAAERRVLGGGAR